MKILYRKFDDELLGIILMNLSILLFVLMDVCIKLASDDYGLLQVMLFRSLACFIPIIIAIYYQGHSIIKLLKTNYISAHLIRGGLGFIAMGLIFYSFFIMPLAEVHAVLFTSPIFTTIFSVILLGERVGIHRWAAILIGFIAIIFMLQPDGEKIIEWQVLIPLSASLILSLVLVLVRQMSKTEPSLRIVFYANSIFAISTIFFSLILLMFEGLLITEAIENNEIMLRINQWQWPVSGYDWLFLLGVGIFGGMAQLSHTESFRLAPISLLGPYKYTAIIWATIFGWIIWQEIPRDNMFVGSAIIIASGVYIGYRNAKSNKRTNRN